MAKVKKQIDVADEVFWDEFKKAEYRSAQRDWVGEETEERPVLITIKDKANGEEWEMEGVMMVDKKGKKYSD